jgi:hypothetical protein
MIAEAWQICPACQGFVDGRRICVGSRDYAEAAAAPGRRGFGNCLMRAVKACAVCRTDLHIVDGELNHPKLHLAARQGTKAGTGTNRNLRFGAAAPIIARGFG